MKSKPPKREERKEKLPVREPQPSSIDVRDSWIEVTERRSPQASLIENGPTLRPPAITLPDDALIIDKSDSDFPDYEAPTLPRARAFRPLLGSLDEAALVRELANTAPQIEREGQEKEPRKTSRPPKRTTTSPPARRVEDLDLSSIPAFEDLTPEMQYLLLAEAVEKRIGATTTIVELDSLLVVKGAVRVGVSRGEGMGGIWNGLVFHAGEVVTRRRGIDGVGDPMVLGGEPGTTILEWTDEAIDQVLGLCPWVDDSLREEGDRAQTLLLLAGKQRRGLWREMMRLSRLTRLEGRTLSPGEQLIAPGAPVALLYTVGFGDIELVDEGRTAGRCGTGDIVFPSCVLAGLPSPQLARAGQKGATVILADTEVLKAALGELPLLRRKLRAAS
jgi:hypothetical protein